MPYPRLFGTICDTCAHRENYKGKKYFSCHTKQLMFDHGPASILTIKSFGCNRYCEKKKQPCYHKYKDGTNCSRNHKGECTHCDMFYKDCQDGWSSDEYDRLHGIGAAQKQKDEIMKRIERGG